MRDLGKIYQAERVFSDLELTRMYQPPVLHVLIESKPIGSTTLGVTCNAQGLDILKAMVDRLIEERDKDNGRLGGTPAESDRQPGFGQDPLWRSW